MRRADAPPAGWYPDPRGAARLRWWDGSDWSDHWRAPVTSVERAIRQGAAEPRPGAAPASPPPRSAGVATFDRAAAHDLIAEVRQVARSEIDRAAEVFTQRAREATREIQPLISQYTNRALRWLRVAAVVAVVLVAAWFLFQAVVQVSFFEWLGDRIDSLTR